MPSPGFTTCPTAPDWALAALDRAGSDCAPAFGSRSCPPGQAPAGTLPHAGSPVRGRRAIAPRI